MLHLMGLPDLTVKHCMGLGAGLEHQHRQQDQASHRRHQRYSQGCDSFPAGGFDKQKVIFRNHRLSPFFAVRGSSNSRNASPFGPDCGGA